MENFDAAAEDFDTTTRIERAKFIADEIHLHILNGQSKTALEYGCGTGLVGFQLIQDFQSILFVDSAKGMREQVKLKLSNLSKSTDYAIRYDFVKNMPKNIKVDYVFTSLALHHIKDTKSILSRLFDVLNDGGHLIIVDINTDDGSFHAKYPDFDGHNGFDQLFITELVEKVGFKKVSIKTFYHGSKIINGEERAYSLFILDATKSN